METRYGIYFKPVESKTYTAWHRPSAYTNMYMFIDNHSYEDAKKRIEDLRRTRPENDYILVRIDEIIEEDDAG